MSNTTIPGGSVVNNWYFLIRNAAGTTQSTDLFGTNYGFTPATASIASFENGQAIKFFDGNMTSTISGNSSVEIYNIVGQKVKSFSISENETIFLNIKDKGVFIAIVKNDNKQKSIKFLN